MIIIAHRGFSAKFPENTLAAFQAAIDSSADMIEFDILLSKDNVPVIIHDETLDRTTNGRGKVASMNLSELKKLDAGQGQAIPTLEELLQLAQGKITLHVEIKSEAVREKVADGVEEQTLALLDKYGFLSSSIISSFSSQPLMRVREMNPKISIATTFDHSLRDADKVLIERMQPSAIHLPIHKIRNDDMDFAMTHGIPVNVYTVNSATHMKQAQDLCVEGIFTNEVEKAIQFFTKRI